MENIESNQNYFECSFNNLVITEARLSAIEFEECDFIECDFSSSCFSSCKFINCSFKRCNLSLLQVSGCRLSEIEFIDCKLIGVDWTKAEWPSYIADSELSFTKCILNDSSFFGLTLNELKLEECKLYEVDFREGDFTDSIIRYCDLSNSQFMHTNLSGVDFTESYNFNIDVLENRVSKAKFSRYEALSLLDGLGIELVD